MSLYPLVCKYFKFTVGHPTIHLECGDVQIMLTKKTGAVHGAASKVTTSAAVHA